LSCSLLNYRIFSILLRILSLVADDTEKKSNVGDKHDKYGEINVTYAVRLKNEVGAVRRATVVAR
jgi:hypothetical protein